MSLLETRIKVEEGLDRTKARNPSLNPRGIPVIIHSGVVVERHPLSKALSVRRQDHGEVEPQPEPPLLVLPRRVAARAEQARRLILRRQPAL